MSMPRDFQGLGKFQPACDLLMYIVDDCACMTRADSRTSDTALFIGSWRNALSLRLGTCHVLSELWATHLNAYGPHIILHCMDDSC